MDDTESLFCLIAAISGYDSNDLYGNFRYIIQLLC